MLRLKMRSDFGAVGELFGRADYGVHGMLDLRHVEEEVYDLLAFPGQLAVVTQVLILTAAALTEQVTLRVNAIR